MSDDERKRLLPAMVANDRRKHLLAIVICDLNLGLRRSELLSLKPGDVDFERGLVSVHSTKTDAQAEDLRDVPMNETVRVVLIGLIEKAKAERWEYLFTNPRTGTRLKSVKKAWAAACKDAGITDLRFHDCRHTFASNAGDDPEVTLAALMEPLGHRDPRTTMRYTHSSSRAKLKVVEAVEKWDSPEAGHQSVTQEKRRTG